jgi:hypothetical protein
MQCIDFKKVEQARLAAIQKRDNNILKGIAFI